MKPKSRPENAPIDTIPRSCYNFTQAERKPSGKSLSGKSFLVSDSYGPPESEGTLMDSDSKRQIATLVRWLHQETMTRLQTLRARTREGKFVDEASEFARWVRFSGIMRLCAALNVGQVKAGPTDLERLRQDILSDCEAFWKHEPRGPWVSLSELEAVNEKLDLIAAQVSRLSARTESNTPAVASGSAPTLHVVDGGLSAQ